MGDLATKKIHRSAFLRGDFRSRRRPIRPPWSLPEAEFDTRCTNCGDCISACPEAILELGRGRLPVIDFRKGACTFCGACAERCEPGAIAMKPGAPWDLKATIDAGCLAANGVICRACGDACEERAIRFQLAVGGIAHADIDLDRCNGCGACISPCPDNAIAMQRLDTVRPQPSVLEVRQL